MVMVFILSQDYWLQIKEFQLELNFSKKELEERFEYQLTEKAERQLDFRNMGAKESKATRTLLSALARHFF